MTIEELRDALVGKRIITREPGAGYETITGIHASTFGGVDVYTDAGPRVRQLRTFTKRRLEMLAERGVSSTRAGMTVSLEKE